MSADLRTLAAEAIRPALLLEAVARILADNFGGTLLGFNRELAEQILAAVLPEHRRMVLGEAAEALQHRADNVPWSDPDIKRGVQYAHSVVVMLARESAAAAPPAGLSGTVPAENAPAAPEATPDDAPLGSEALALAEHFRSLGCGQVVDPVDLEDCAGMAEEVLRFLGTRGWAAPAVPEEARHDAHIRAKTLADVLDALRDDDAYRRWRKALTGVRPEYPSLTTRHHLADYLTARFAPTTAPEGEKPWPGLPTPGLHLVTVEDMNTCVRCGKFTGRADCPGDTVPEGADERNGHG